MNSSLFRLTATSLISAACLAACGGGGGGGGGTSVASQTTSSPSTPTTTPSTPANPAPAVQFGTANVVLAAEPGCGFDAVNVTVTKIRFNMSATATDASPGWTDITLAQPQRVNMAQLRNGATLNLGSAALLPGHYAQARLVLDANNNNSTVNSVVPTGTTTEVPLITQTVSAEGVAFGSGFDIANGQTLSLVADFDSCRSVVPNNANFLLRPVMTQLPAAKNGISGIVNKAQLGDNVRVSAQQKGVIVRAALPDPSTGEFVLARLDPGSYDIVITSDNGGAAVVAGVTVAADSNIVALNTAAAPITLGASTMGQINANLSLIPASAVEAPFGSALQSFGTGPVITVGARMANLATGNVTFPRLPMARPLLATWQAGQALSFDTQAPVSPGPGIYTIAASAPGYTTTRTLPFPAAN
jgi:hypothetical protein